MKLRGVLEGVYTKSTFTDCEVKDVVIDSRKVTKGSVFVCIKGRKFDGHNAAKNALDNGAVAVVTERPLGLENEIVVENSRLANAVMCQNFFDNPQSKLTVIAVTGTNGKTTVSNTLDGAREHLGHKTGLIGTIHCEIGDLIVPAKFTTPEPWDTCALMARMVAAECTHLVMEASSQALEQGRLLNMRFACGVFTNLTQDHLDYHGTMESYYEAKKMLFSLCDCAVINIDDDYGKRLIGEIECPIVRYSIESDDADYTAKSIDCSITGVKFAVNSEGFLSRIRFSMPGMYSVHNALAAACALFTLGVERSQACEAVSSTRGVKGRCEILYAGAFTVICDYAHTGDALAQLLSSLKPFVPGRLVTLFGCAGDRDPKKRPAMAEAVCKYSDMVILTSDNPRTEDPLAIIKEIQPMIAATGVEYTAEPDRYFAILWALENLKSDDVLVLCGKGHEDYQVIDGCTIYLDEHKIVADYFESIEKDV